LDTRTKILPTAEFAATAGPIVVGFFDPVTLDHSARLESLAAEFGPLRVIIDSPPDPLMPPEARAAVVAAFACVKAVTIGGALPAQADLRGEDIARRSALIAHVHAKHAQSTGA
jgi:hypothetical protein